MIRDASPSPGSYYILPDVLGQRCQMSTWNAFGMISILGRRACGLLTIETTSNRQSRSVNEFWFRKHHAARARCICFFRFTASSGGANESDRRVFTSTNTIVALCSATMSISHPPARTFLARSLYPARFNARAASFSPVLPVSLVFGTKLFRNKDAYIPETF